MSAKSLKESIKDVQDGAELDIEEINKQEYFARLSEVPLQQELREEERYHEELQEEIEQEIQQQLREEQLQDEDDEDIPLESIKQLKLMFLLDRRDA